MYEISTTVPFEIRSMSRRNETSKSGQKHGIENLTQAWCQRTYTLTFQARFIIMRPDLVDAHWFARQQTENEAMSEVLVTAVLQHSALGLVHVAAVRGHRSQTKQALPRHFEIIFRQIQAARCN